MSTQASATLRLKKGSKNYSSTTFELTQESKIIKENLMRNSVTELQFRNLKVSHSLDLNGQMINSMIKSQQLRRLCFENCSLYHIVDKITQVHLSSNSISELLLAKCSIDNHAFEKLIDGIKESHTLSKVVLDQKDNNLSIKNLSNLFDACLSINITNLKIKYPILLDNKSLPSGVDFSKISKNKTLKKVVISGSVLSEEDFSSMIVNIKANKVLENITVKYKYLSTKEGLLFGEFLSTNRKLLLLNLTVKLSDRALKYFSEGIVSNQKVKEFRLKIINNSSKVPQYLLFSLMLNSNNKALFEANIDKIMTGPIRRSLYSSIINGRRQGKNIDISFNNFELSKVLDQIK